MRQSIGAIAERLRAQAPDLDLVTQQDDLDRLAKDWWPVAGKWTERERVAHRPLCAVHPRHHDQVAVAVRVAGEIGLAVIACGARSGVVGGIVSRGGAMAIDMTGCDELIEFDQDRRFVTAGAGHSAGDLEQKLNAQGFTLGHYPQSLHLASIGGLVATRSSGTFSNKYGGIEQLVVGLKAVMSDGETVAVKPTPRSATGPSLLSLFIGSEGSLGVITEVTLRAFPLPESRVFAGYAFDELDSAMAAVAQSFAQHVVPAVIRVYDEIEARGLFAKAGIESRNQCLIITGHDGARNLVETECNLFARIAMENSGQALGPDIGDAWEAHRYNADWLINGNQGPGNMADAIEIAAHWPDIVPIYREVRNAVADQCTLFMGHMSHFYSTGGCLYLIFTVKDDTPQGAVRRYWTIWDTAMEITLKHRGSISHHHGIGTVRAGRLAQELGSAHGLLRVVKSAIDPANRLNPGKFGLSADQR